MADIFTVQIITPDRIFYEGEATMIEFNTEAGEIGVYPRHIPLTTVIRPGVVTIHEESGDKKAAVHAGFAEILPDKVSIMAEIAEWADEIDLERAEEAKKRAEERIAEKTQDTDMDRAELALKKAVVRIQLAGK
ncbi:MAG: ATP synthase F1 subunit epsilon [Lachnospiraceae bacterium]|nr:ATP synthase F1 subunit epsilon [Lachnospiraceae bacterium]